MPPRPRDTNRLDSPRAAASRGWSPRRGDCAASSQPRAGSVSVRMTFILAEVASMPDSEVAQLPVLRLKRNEDRRLHAGHLWIFSNDIDTGQTALPKFQAGELVRVLAHNDRALGLAYVNPKSLIAARMLETWQIADAKWLAARIRAAMSLRDRLYPTPYYRLVYGESDGLPGLVIDRYGTRCVAKIGTAGMERLKPQNRQTLNEVLQCDGLLFKNDSSARGMDGLAR